MSKKTRSDDWGFPRWRGYGTSRDAVKVRLCDRFGCTNPGDRPAPKAPNSPERWWFCLQHAAEYNSNWDYFQGLSAEEAAERKQTSAVMQADFRTPSIMAGVVREMARAAGMRCARLMSSGLKSMPSLKQ